MQASHPVCTHTAFVLQVRYAGIAPLVLLCGSRHLSVQRSAALVLGNLAQDDTNREEVGRAGGVEALFVLTDVPDSELQTNSCWALSNLAWNAGNQERIGRFLVPLLSLCEHHSVRSRCQRAVPPRSNRSLTRFRLMVASSCFAEGRSVPCTAGAGQLAVLSAHEPLPCV